MASISVGQVGGYDDQTFGPGKFTGHFALPRREGVEMRLDTIIINAINEAALTTTKLLLLTLLLLFFLLRWWYIIASQSQVVIIRSVKISHQS